MITVQADTLRDAVGWLSRHTPKRPYRPALGAHVLEFDGSTLTLSVYDYETFARVSVDASGEPVRVLVNGALLASVVGRLSGLVEIEPDERQVTVRTGRNRYRLGRMPETEYPEVPEPAEPVGTIDAGVLVDVTGRAGACLSNDRALPELCCFQIETTNTEMTVYATDRYRLAKCQVPWDGSDLGVLVPGVGLVDAVRDMTGQVTIGVDDRRFTVSDASRLVTLTLNAASLKPLGRLIKPETVSTEVGVERDRLVDAVKSARAVLTRGANVVFGFDKDGTLTVSAQEDVSDSATVVETSGGSDQRVVFNADYVETVAAAVPGTSVVFGLPDGSRPVLVHGEVDGERVGGASFILMPIRG